MFTYIELKNFKSFGEIRFDFKRTVKETKKFVAVYGENGSGKSNFVSAFEFVYCSLKSLMFRGLVNMLDDSSTLKDKPSISHIESLLELMSVKFSNYRLINCSEPTTVELGFEIDKTEGYYKIEFADTVLFEELYYLCGKNRKKVFTITPESTKISPSLFSNPYAVDFENELKKFWGKHTFFAVLANEIISKNNQYIENNVSKQLLDVYNTLDKICVFGIRDSRPFPHGGLRSSKYSYYGTIPLKGEMKLDKNEKILNDLITQLYSDIKSVHYEKTFAGNNIEYLLHAQKIIAGKVRDIPFDYESTGTKGLLGVLSAVVAVMNGEAVIYDEIDSGIHDLLMQNLISSLVDAAPGQLIITTHNTLLLESMDPQSAYVIYVDCDGNKEARCVADYGERIQKTNNMRNLYIKGMYGGIPYASEIDFSCCANISESGDDVDE